MRRYTRGMRDFLVFVLLVLGIFFGVGEWRGWQLGVPGQTPVYVYKADGTAEISRRTINRDTFPLELWGRVRNGDVTVTVTYQDLGSFQEGTRSGPVREIFDETYSFGERIDLNELLDEGFGRYTVRLDFSEATGLFRFRVPGQPEL